MVYIVTQSNYYPETRAQDDAEWTTIVSVHSSLEGAEQRVRDELVKLEAFNRDMYEDPDYSLAEDASADTFIVTKHEVLP